jgi:predicted DNA-binding ribbon-helix-helix protein
MEKKRTDRSVRRPGTHYVGLDLKDSVYDELSKIAEADHRSLSNLIRMILDQYLSVYKSSETVMSVQKMMGQLPMKKDFENSVNIGDKDHTVGDLSNSDDMSKRRQQDRDGD